MRKLLLLAAILSPAAIAIPTDRTATSTSTAVHSFKRLQNAIIERIWRTPQHQSSPCYHGRVEATIPPKIRARYGRDIVLRFDLASQADADAISSAANILYLDVWESTDEWVDIRIAKDILATFLGLLPRSLRDSHKPLLHDLAQTVYETYPYSAHTSHPDFAPVSETTTDPDQGRELFFQEYQPLSVIYPWLRLMASIFPDHVEKITIGTSNQGREISGLRVGSQRSTNTTDSPPRKTILLTGGSHAREWISTSTVNYIAYSLITRYGKFDGVTKFLDAYDLIFIPTLNPDGYVYTWEVDRLWRKNRQETTLPFCKGVDLDRAFGYEWDGSPAADNPCSETYAGAEAFSGTEAMALATWARNQSNAHAVEFVSFIDFHSYSQQVLYPYSYSCTEMPRNLEDLEEVALGLAKGFRLSKNHFYSVSSACEGSITVAKPREEIRTKMSLGGGSALDWFYHELNVKYAYQIKLRDTGSYGFLLPKANIVPTGQEAFNAIMSLGRYLLGNKGIESVSEEQSMVDWEKEFILPADRTKAGLGTSLFPQEGGAVQEVFLGHDEDKDEFNAELRRRR